MIIGDEYFGVKCSYGYFLTIVRSREEKSQVCEYTWNVLFGMKTKPSILI